MDIGGGVALKEPPHLHSNGCQHPEYTKDAQWRLRTKVTNCIFTKKPKSKDNSKQKAKAYQHQLDCKRVYWSIL